MRHRHVRSADWLLVGTSEGAGSISEPHGRDEIARLFLAKS